MEGHPAPDFSAVGLPDVVPSVARSLGVPGPDGEEGFVFAPARRGVVVLLDGLGDDLLRQRSGHAPFLRSLLATAHRVPCGFPSTTATSMGSFGTGLRAGRHGLVGYEVLVPERDRLLNELSWDDGPDPERWQPEPTVFERAAAAGLSVTRVGPGYFDGSGLTRAALRGGRFVAATSLGDRVDATLAALAAGPRSLVYLYWGDLDKVGHVHGAGSWEWGNELEAVDRELARLAARLPGDASLTITADHGMVDVPHALRLDVAHEPDLALGVRHVGGEPRAPQLYPEPGQAAAVAVRWAERLGERAWVRTREEVIADGWFGPVAPRNLARIGEVVVAMVDTFAVVDSRRARPEVLALLGLHGSITEAEVAVPVLHVPPRATA